MTIVLEEAKFFAGKENVWVEVQLRSEDQKAKGWKPRSGMLKARKTKTRKPQMLKTSMLMRMVISPFFGTAELLAKVTWKE
jgi:hypothetical protein